MAEQATKKLDKKWISFGTLMLGAGTIYKLGFLKDAFYVPMQEFMGLSHKMCIRDRHTKSPIQSQHYLCKLNN